MSDRPRASLASAASTLRLESRIPRGLAATTLLDYLANRFRYLDRGAWSAELAAGRVFLDGRIVRTDRPIRGGERVAYERPHHEPPVDRDVRVLHADAAIVVVDKPAHLPAHADGPFVRNTLIQILRERLAAPELRLVHRLDRETSGVCVLAHTEAARAFVAEQFARGAAEKSYVAIVRGRPATMSFTVDQAIGRAPNSIVALRRCADANAIDAKPARTDFEVLRVGAHCAMVRCTPRTGRTHQIRVHLESVGLPVLGDKLYGRPDADYLAFVQRVKAGGVAADVGPGEPGRHLLHAARLSFVHPEDGAMRTFEAPLPAEFTTWLDASPA